MNKESLPLLLLWITSAMVGSFSCTAAIPASPVLQWVQRYNGPAGREDYPKGIAIDTMGNVAVTGHSFNSDDDVDYGTAKYAAANGTLQWQRRFDGLTMLDDYAEAIAIDSEGNVIVTGYTPDLESSYDVHTIKYSATQGGVLWERRVSNGGGRAVAVTLSDDIIVTGNRFNETNSDFYTAKYAGTDGALLWERMFNGPGNKEDVAEAVAVDPFGDIAVVGQCDDDENGSDYCTVKYSGTNGTLLWSKVFTDNSRSPPSIAVDTNGDVVVAGTTYSSEFYTAKYASADGSLLWEKRYSGPSSDQAMAIAVDAEGNVVVTGSSVSPQTGRDFYTIKYAGTNGSVLWDQRYDGPSHRADVATTVAIDWENNVVVAGYSANVWDDDYCIVKYSGVDGAVLWAGRYDGPEHGDDRVSQHCLAVATNGNIAITGSSSGDYVTIVFKDPSPTIDSYIHTNGVLMLTGTGLPNFRYRIEVSTNLSQWLEVETQTSGSNGLFQFVDVNAVPPRKFYRIRGH